MANFLGNRRRWILPVSIVGVGLAIGFLTVPEYGYSWDEFANASYGREALDRYVSEGVFWRADERGFEKPSFYFMAFNVSARLLQGLFPSWLATDARHFSNHAVFLLGIAFFYLLCRRHLPQWPALGATLLFATQPLYYGHSFINQKDIPFLSLFIVAVYFGFRAVDGLATSKPGHPETQRISERGLTGRVRAAVGEDWRRLRPEGALGIIALIVIFIALSVELFREALLLPWAQEILNQAYREEALPPITRAFQMVAEDRGKTSLDLYSRKLTVAYRWIRLLLVPLLVVGLLRVLSAVFTDTKEAIGRTRLENLGRLLVAALALGLASSTREGGPFAGLLVVALMFYRLKARSIGPILIYSITAFGVMYLTWPTLWGNPLGKLLSRFGTVTSFDEHFVLYQTIHHSSQELPWHYLPDLLLKQHTLLSIAAILVGLVALAIDKWEIPKGSGVELLLYGAWWAVPFLSVVALGTPIYNNFRHVFFSIPPLFIMAGFGLRAVMELVSMRPLGVVLILGASVPGIMGIVNNFPYQYVYYNALAGGNRGAVGVYEFDYWCTSYREAMGYVNSEAGQDARIAVYGPMASAAAFARDDLVIVPEGASVGPDGMALACDNVIGRDSYYRALNVVHQVKLDEAVLAEVKAVTVNSEEAQ